MAQNLLNPNAVHVGAGKIEVSGDDIGILSGAVNFTYTPTYNDITGGSPEVTIRSSLASEEAILKASAMEINPDMLAKLIPQFTQVVESSGDVAVTNEYLGAVSASAWLAASNDRWTNDTVTVRLTSALATSAAAGGATIYVEDASLFTAGDTVTLVEGESTENLTIDADGVDTSANTLTFTTNLTGNYTINAIAVNTGVDLVDGTDYELDRLNGRILLLATSTKISEGDTVSAGYTHTTVTANALYFGGKTATFTYPLKFTSDERPDGKRYYIELFRAQYTGTLSLDFDPSNPTLINVEIKALTDSTKAEGKKLGKWYLA
jgi:hypothetical protein